MREENKRSENTLYLMLKMANICNIIRALRRHFLLTFLRENLSQAQRDGPNTPYLFSLNDSPHQYLFSLAFRKTVKRFHGASKTPTNRSRLLSSTSVPHEAIDFWNHIVTFRCFALPEKLHTLCSRPRQSSLNPFTPELKKYILPTFWRKNA